jgi:sugar phosphate isomerase/epimerase
MKLGFALYNTPERQASRSAYKEFEQKLKVLSKIGYKSVELGIKAPQRTDILRIKQLLSTAGLSLSAIATGGAYLENKINLVAEEKRERQKALKFLQNSFELAKEVNAAVIIGLIRGVVLKSSAISEAWNWLLRALEECVKVASSLKIKLLLEPLNRYETTFIHRVDEAVSVIEKLKSPYLSLLADTYHMHLEESSIYKALMASKKYLTYLHFSDTNRWPPGMGEINFKEIFKTLKKINFKGRITVEIASKPYLKVGAEISWRHLNTFLSSRASYHIPR